MTAVFLLLGFAVVCINRTSGKQLHRMLVHGKTLVVMRQGVFPLAPAAVLLSARCFD